MKSGGVMKKKYELVLFDLDGTLLDTSLGIFNSVRYAEEQLGLMPVPDNRLSEFVGPPPKTMYAQIYGLEEERAFLAAQKHREYSRTKAIYEAAVYPEIVQLLAELKSQGYKLGVTTLKSQGIAESILKHYELSSYFDVIIGMDARETLTKCRAIQLAISETASRGNVVLIGDSQYDYVGAQEAGVDFIGVLYGFGFHLDCQYPFVTIVTPKEASNYL